jgi:small subunit ribosomal protein S14
MTTSHYSKVLKQIRSKGIKAKKFQKHNTPKERTYGRVTKKCKRCGRYGGHISKYGVHLCRQCFREVATNIGFKKYN